MPRSDYLITLRRKEEDYRNEYNTIARTQQELKYKAVWENKTANAIQKNTVLRRYRELLAEDETKLNERRSKLATLITSENRKYEHEIENMGETTEERRKRLEAKALALREERERLRSDYVDEQMVRRFREGCDDLRNLESHELQRQVVETREQQMQRKLDEAEKQTIKDLEFAAEWEALRQQKILRDEQDLERNKKLQDETIFCLNVQKDAIADRRAEEQRERERMAQEMKEAWIKEQKLAEEEEANRIRRQEQARDELNAFNSFKIKMDGDKRKAEKDEDMRLIGEIIAREKEQIAKEQAKKDRNRKEALAFREELEALMIKEAEDEGEIDRFIEEDVQKEWQKRADQWQREKDAREALMAEVLEERQLQMEEKWRHKERMRDHAEREKERMAMELERAKQLEAREEGVRSRQKEAYRDALREQIHNRRLDREMSAAEKALEARGAAEAEYMYQQRLQRELQQGVVVRQHHRKNTSWYD